MSLEVELLTPAFIGGFEPRRLDKYMQLRPSTVRGMLRWWFRAGAGALLWPEDSNDAEARDLAIAALREAESAVFGSTNHSSPVVVLPPEGGEAREIHPPDPASFPGIRYLGYGLFDGRNRAPEALLTPPPLTLTLGLRRPPAGARELLGATVWLWTTLGGLGARSRRGFGSMKMVSGGDLLGWPETLLHNPDSHAELARQIAFGLDWAGDVFGTYLPKLTPYPLRQGAGPHRALRTIDGIKTVSVLPVDAPSGREAMERAGRLFRDFRSTLRRSDQGMSPLADYFAVKASIQSGHPPSTVDRAAFGLPLPFYFRSLGGAKATFLPAADQDNQALDRLASPLSFRVHNIGRGKSVRYVMVLLNLAEVGNALPLLDRELVEREMRRRFPAPNGRIISQFISWAMEQAERAPYARRRDR